jgi:LPPG:FO 2-phospho-L-lactate transferase
MMAAMGLPVSIGGVAQAYEDFLDVLVVDNQDKAVAQKLQAAGFHVKVTNTIMKTRDDRVNLARAVLAACEAEGGVATSPK